MSRQIELLCSIDFEQTAESFHAHAIPEGVHLRPGDMVLVHDTPAFGFGDVVTGERRATLTRAGLGLRIWTRLSSIFEITELFEVGFSPVADAMNLKG